MREKIYLLVEDNLDDIKLTLRAFKNNNIANELQIAHDREETLEYLFKRGEFSTDNPTYLLSVILLDLKLLKVDGFEGLKELRSNPMTKLIPVVIITSSKEEDDIVKGYTFGANSYILKPINFHAFLVAELQFVLYWLLLNEIPPAKI